MSWEDFQIYFFGFVGVAGNEVLRHYATRTVKPRTAQGAQANQGIEWNYWGPTLAMMMFSFVAFVAHVLAGTKFNTLSALNMGLAMPFMLQAALAAADKKLGRVN